MTERRDTQVFEIGIGEIAQDLFVDRVIGKRLGVLSETAFSQPSCDPIRHYLAACCFRFAVYRASAQRLVLIGHASVETRHVLKSPSPEGRRRRRYSVAWGGGRLRGALIRDTQAFYKAFARLRFVRNK